MSQELNIEAAIERVERRLSDMWDDAKVEWGDAVGGPGEHEIFAQKILSAVRDELGRAPAAAQQAGWVSVPVEPTPAMLLAAGYRASAVGASTTGHEAYRAMIAAAPRAPAEAPIDTTGMSDGAIYAEVARRANVAAEAASVRDQALAEAAWQCDHRAANWRSFEGETDMQERAEAAEICSDAIRALQGKPEAAKGGEPC